MRAFVTVLVAASVFGCGRVGYDASSPSGDSSAPMDTSTGLDSGDGSTGTDAGDGSATTDSGAPWWDLNWRFRKALTIDSASVFDDLTNFPVLVELDDGDLAANARPDGSDLLFVDAAGVAVPFQVELYDTGHLIAWVRLTDIAADADTTFHLYYGDARVVGGAVDTSAPWVNGFTAVYHFGDGATVQTTDSTNTNDGTNNGATGAPGKIHGAASFSGGPNIKADSTGVNTGPGEHNTVSFWMNYRGPYEFALFAFIDGTTGYDLWFTSDGCFGFNTQGGDVLGTTEMGLDNRWVYVVAVFYNGVPTAGQNELYIDGVPQTLTNCRAGTASSRNAGDTLYWASTDGYEFTGELDEGRVANVVRSPGWIRTEFENQNAPGSFVTVGPEETAP